MYRKNDIENVDEEKYGCYLLLRENHPTAESGLSNTS